LRVFGSANMSLVWWHWDSIVFLCTLSLSIERPNAQAKQV